MSEHRVEDPALESAQGSRMARLIRVLALPIVLVWVAIAVSTIGKFSPNVPTTPSDTTGAAAARNRRQQLYLVRK